MEEGGILHGTAVTIPTSVLKSKKQGNLLLLLLLFLLLL